MAFSSNTTETGEQKFARFYLRELLNSGGMSEIWLATDGRNKPFALRRLKRELRDVKDTSLWSLLVDLIERDMIPGGTEDNLVNHGAFTSYADYVIEPLAVPDHIVAPRASEPPVDPADPIFAEYGYNALKGRLRSHRDVAERFYRNVELQPVAAGGARS